MIDFTNYTPSPSQNVLDIPVYVLPTSDLASRTFPGVIDSVSFSLILMAVFIITLPVVLWLIETGRVKNE